jgi:uncharacterized protein (DUF2147 family)
LGKHKIAFLVSSVCKADGDSKNHSAVFQIMTMKWLFLSLFAFVSIAFTGAENADAIVGIWKNGTGKGHIQIYKHEGKYHGKIIWLKDALDKTGKPKTDFRNEDPARKNKPLIGLQMLRDFRYEDGEWTGGRIYNPGDGKEYKAYIKMKDVHTLQVRGYMGISLIGKTDTWTRVK